MPPVAAAQPSDLLASGAPAPSIANADQWHELIGACGLKGPILQLASHCAFIDCDQGVLRLYLAPEDAHLRNDNTVRQLTAAINASVGAPLQLRFEQQSPSNPGDTLHARNSRQRSERQLAAEASFLADPVVSQLIGNGASLVADSIRPQQEN